MKTVREFRQLHNYLKGQKDLLEKELSSAKTELKVLERDRIRGERARAIHQEVARMTQEELRFHIEDLVSSALTAVFDDPYELSVEFVVRRNKTECDLYFTRDGSKVSPLEASGGGAVDVASFALRLAVWALRTPKTRPFLVPDEPFKFLSAELMPRASVMMKEIAKRMGVQMLMVTHSEDLVDAADRVFRVTQKNGVSSVRVL